MVEPAPNAIRVRKDVATLGSGWNLELLWYAKAVRELSTKGPGDRTGWRYLGAIHGFDRDNWIDRGIISSTDPLPSAAEQATMWDQCQHQGWYFLPWHRGYLAAFEAIVAATIEALGGPADWALPYWNYLDTSNPDARRIPDALLASTLPDGSPNPLAQAPRQGTVLGPRPGVPDIDLASMSERIYTSPPGGRAFGGGATGFMQFGGKTGAMEGNPHNNVHVMIGGLADPVGFMSDPELAGLDPIFWLHHCNIDRLWAAWLTRSGNVMENGQPWGGGPFPRRFQMPQPDGSLAIFTPAECLPGGPLAPTYDDLTIGTGAGAVPAAIGEEDTVPAQLSEEPPAEAHLAGANAESLTVHPAQAVDTSVELAEAGTTIAGVQDERVILNLENIRGEQPSGALNIYISGPDQGAGPASVEEPHESVALFGLAKASAADDAHGGNGISVAVDITDLVARLADEAGADLRRLQVRIEQPGEGARPITVGRVSIYKQPVG